jgi:hypothetical protein
MPTIAELPPAIVTEVSENGVTALIKSGDAIFVPWQDNLAKVRRYRSVNQTAAPEKTAADLLAPGDLIRVHSVEGQWRPYASAESAIRIGVVGPKAWCHSRAGRWYGVRTI